MNKKPKKSNESLFSNGLWGNIFVEGCMIGILTLFAFSIGNKLYGVEVGRTMAFFALSSLELVHSFNVKSEGSIFKATIFNNFYLIGAFIVGIALQVLVIVIPPIAHIFDSVPLNSKQWLIIALISILPIVIIEIQKRINDIRFGKIVYTKEEAKSKKTEVMPKMG